MAPNNLNKFSINSAIEWSRSQQASESSSISNLCDFGRNTNKTIQPSNKTVGRLFMEIMLEKLTN